MPKGVAMTEKSLNKPAVFIIEKKIAFVVSYSAAVSYSTAARLETCGEPNLGYFVYFEPSAVIPEDFRRKNPSVGSEFCNNMNISFHIKPPFCRVYGINRNEIENAELL